MNQIYLIKQICSSQQHTGLMPPHSEYKRLIQQLAALKGKPIISSLHRLSAWWSPTQQIKLTGWEAPIQCGTLESNVCTSAGLHMPSAPELSHLITLQIKVNGIKSSIQFYIKPPQYISFIQETVEETNPDSQNPWSWSPSPTLNPTLNPALNHSPQHHIYKAFQSLQEWGLNHCSGQPELSLDNPFQRETSSCPT